MERLSPMPLVYKDGYPALMWSVCIPRAGNKVI